MSQCVWTDERVDRLKSLWREGLSASQVAKALGGVSLSEAETLALLLRRSGASGPEALSEALLARFGCTARVLGATLAELLQIAPLEVALDLQLLHEATRRVLEFPILQRPLLSSFSAVEAYLRHRPGAVPSAVPRSRQPAHRRRADGGGDH
jgi:hypothetical protein